MVPVYISYTKEIIAIHHGSSINVIDCLQNHDSGHYIKKENQWTWRLSDDNKKLNQKKGEGNKSDTTPVELPMTDAKRKRKTMKIPIAALA